MFQVTLSGEISGQLIENNLSTWMEAKSGCWKQRGGTKRKDGRLQTQLLLVLSSLKPVWVYLPSLPLSPQLLVTLLPRTEMAFWFAPPKLSVKCCLGALTTGPVPSWGRVSEHLLLWVF